MRFSSWPASVVVAAAIAAGIAGYYHLQTVQLGRATATLARQIAAAEEADRIANQAGSHTARLPSGPTPATDHETTPSTTNANWVQALENSPRRQTLALAYQRSVMAISYAPLFRALALSPAQIAQFEDNLEQKQADEMDLSAVIRTQGLGDGDPQVQNARRQSDLAYQAAQTSLLGDKGYQQLIAFDQDSAARSTIDSVAGAAVVAGIPFTTDQTNQLHDLLVQSEQTPGDIDAVNWDRFDQAAAAVLTPLQFEFFRSAESLGPEGRGGRYLLRMGFAVFHGEQADAATGNATLSPR
jgi:hypothetical protein